MAAQQATLELGAADLGFVLAAGDDLDALALFDHPNDSTVVAEEELACALADYVIDNPQIPLAERMDFGRHVMESADQLERTFDGGWFVPPHVVVAWTNRHGRLAIPQPVLRNRGQRGRPARRVTRRHSRRARSVDREPDDEPQPQPCECGCGELAPAGRRTVDEVHATRIRVRRCRDRKRGGLDPATLAAEQELARYERRRAGQVRQAQAHGRARAHVEVLARRRLEIYLALPSANGDGPALRVELDRLTRELEDGWDAVRTVEAVTR